MFAASARQDDTRHQLPAMAPRCLNANCDRYGDPSLRDYCSRCASQRGIPLASSSPVHGGLATAGEQQQQRSSQRSAAATTTSRQAAAGKSRLVVSGEAHSPHRGSSRALAQVERQVAGSRQKCRYPGCENYGNPNNQGYCNAGHIECDTPQFL